jgi:copper chaperone CopZ
MTKHHLVVPIADFGCAASGALILERALERVPGVAYVYVNPATEMAYLDIDPEQCDRATIDRAIATAGFHVADVQETHHRTFP